MKGEVIYIIHPYAGKGRPWDRWLNRKRVARIAKELHRLGAYPVSPIHAMSYYKDTNPEERKRGIEIGGALMMRTDAVCIAGKVQDSVGSQAEITVAKTMGKKIYFATWKKGKLLVSGGKRHEQD